MSRRCSAVIESILVDYRCKEEVEDGVFAPFGVTEMFTSHVGGIGEQLGVPLCGRLCTNSGSLSHSSKWLAAERSWCLALPPALGKGLGSERA